MSSVLGPDIITDNLVFGYDTGYPIADNEQSLRFNKGQPVTNLFTTVGTPSNVDQNVTFSVNGTGTFKRVAIGTKIGKYKVKDTDVVYSYDLGGTGCHYHGNDYSSVSSGTKVSFSIEYFLTDDVVIVSNYLGNFEQLSGVGGSWGSVNSETGVWHKVSFTRTAASTGNLRMLMYPGACGSSTLSNQGKIYYKNPTVTLTDHNVPFVSGIRSTTQSLIDLAGTTDVDVDDVSFDSNAQLLFDGTDDHITINNPDISADSFTIQMVVKPDSYSNNPMLINPNSTGIDQYIRIWSNGQIGGVFVAAADTSGDTCRSSTQLSTSEYTHFTITKSPSAIKVYINGNLETTVTPTVSAAAWTGTWDIGQRVNNTYNYNGAIPILKVYNTPLTADEVKINFNSIKKRFGI